MKQDDRNGNDVRSDEWLPRNHATSVRLDTVSLVFDLNMNFG